MKAITQWLTNLFVQFLDGLQAIGGTSPLPSSKNFPSATLPKSSPQPISEYIKKQPSEAAPKNPEAEFQALLRSNGIVYFTADELFYRGARDKQLKLNSTPPKGLWSNLLDVARVADEARRRLGRPLRITSAYRSPEYNKAIDGSKASQHMKGKALDLMGSPATLYKILLQMRKEGFFKGGIGKYKTFIHVDVRGTNANW